MKKWSDMDKVEKISAIIRMVNKGMTAAQIAGQFQGCTRNAIVGLAHRSGVRLANSKAPKRALDPANTNNKAAKKPAAKPASKTKPAKVTRIKKAAKRPKAEPTVCEILKFEPPKRKDPPYSMTELRPRDCRWPISESYRGLSPDQMMFCGKSRDGASQYCCQHRAAAFGGFSKIKGPSDGKSEAKPVAKRRLSRWQM